MRLRNLSATCLFVVGACASHGGADDVRGGSPGTMQPTPVTPVPHGGSFNPPTYCTGVSAASAPQSYGCGIISSLGIQWADSLFLAEVNAQKTFWAAVPANVSMYDDCDSAHENAVSFRDSPQIDFGKNLFWNVYNKFNNSYSIYGILAHEWGHQVQFQFGYINSESVYISELEADAFSGFYLYWAKQFDSTRLSTYLDTLFSLGDMAYNEPNHHGTPIERKHLGLFGMATAANYAQAMTTPTYDQLHQAFIKEITGRVTLGADGLETLRMTGDDPLARQYIPAHNLTNDQMLQLRPVSQK